MAKRLATDRILLGVTLVLFGTGLLMLWSASQPLSAAKKTLLKSILLSGLPSDSYWTLAWFDYVNNPSDPMAFEVVNARLSILVKYILGLPEYQLA